MKKFLKYSLAVVASVVGLTACTNEQDDIFGSTAADRLNETTAETAKILASKPNGWVLQMFTTEREPGYTFLCDFSSNGSVRIAGNHKWIGGTYQEEVSLYQMIADNGPGLSFSTYNQVFHILATPEDVGETNIDEQGYGHKGDYEFILMDVTDNYIKLKGKKWGQKASLTPLPADVDWQQYLADLAAEQKALFSPKIPQFEMVTPNGTYTITHPDYGYFYIVAPGGDMIAETDYAPFVVAPGEISLWKPYTGKDDEISVENFAIADDGYLRCTDPGSEGIYIKAPSIVRLLSEPMQVMTLVEDDRGNLNPSMAYANTEFIIDLDSFSGELSEAYTAMYNAVNKANIGGKRNQRIRSMKLAYRQTDGALGLMIETQNFAAQGGAIYLGIDKVDGKLQFTDMEDGTGNPRAFYSAVPAVVDFVKVFCSSAFKFEEESPLTIGTVSVVADNGNSFIMSL